MDIAGIDNPHEDQAESMLSLMKDDTGKQEVFCEYFGEAWGLFVQKIIQDDQYKYVHNVTDTDELYDLKSDPGEINNLIDNVEMRPVLLDLRNRLLEWMRKTEDPLVSRLLRAFEYGRKHL